MCGRIRVECMRVFNYLGNDAVPTPVGGRAFERMLQVRGRDRQALHLLLQFLFGGVELFCDRVCARSVIDT